MLLQMTRPVQAGLRKQKHLEVISNHLANANTTGFKKDVLSFDRMMKAEMTVDHSQGSLRKTSSKLDVALKSPGFFKIQTPQGIRYTRDGNFSLNVDSNIVTQTGDLVLGEGGQPLTIVGDDQNLQSGKININTLGEIEIDGGAIGRLMVADFTDINQLEKDGSNYYVNTGTPDNEINPENVAIEQGFLELSNISSVSEMIGMIDAHRMYETFQKMMQTLDDADSSAIDTVGRVG